ncbi:unnamed protein product [Amoebophrya sp. A25]|nr:unnamed protein product [Amoebophrya sp. A25]|eukprot:GSA25T00008334001.1
MVANSLSDMLAIAGTSSNCAKASLWRSSSSSPEALSDFYRNALGQPLAPDKAARRIALSYSQRSPSTSSTSSAFLDCRTTTSMEEEVAPRFPRSSTKTSRTSTSFYMDCTDVLEGGSTDPTLIRSECKEFKGLFAAKELVPEAMLSCGDTHPVKGHDLDPWRRLHYIKETNTNMWYKCCEQRNAKQFVFNTGPAPTNFEGPFLPGLGPVHGLAKKVVEELRLVGDFATQIYEKIRLASISGGLFGGNEHERTLEKAQLASIKAACLTSKQCMGKSYTDQRVIYNMQPPRFLRCSLMQDLKTHVDAFGRRKTSHDCASFKRRFAEKLLSTANGFVRVLMKQAMKFVPPYTPCRGQRYSCLIPYDGMGKKQKENLEEPTCVDSGWKNEPWTFPHNYMVTYL